MKSSFLAPQIGDDYSLEDFDSQSDGCVSIDLSLKKKKLYRLEGVRKILNQDQDKGLRLSDLQFQRRGEQLACEKFPCYSNFIICYSLMQSNSVELI